MSKDTTLTEPMLWDEIMKALVYTMPEQLFPLIEEVYGITYPKGTAVQFLSTEQPVFPNNTAEAFTSQFMDLSVLINGTDYYHIECQMKNDHQMVIRMLSYDLHFAMQHCETEQDATGEMILYFPRSVVLYPEKNGKIPDKLCCRIIFQDNSVHTYQVPTVKMQDYSMEEIQRKHLILFLPYVLLRLRPQLENHNRIKKEELTYLVNSVIVILNEEVQLGNITELQQKDILELFNRASKKIFTHYPEYQREVSSMTELKIKTLSMQLAEQEEQLAEKDEQLAVYKAELAEQAATIAKLKKQLADLQ
ncbi:MAG: hypothetical protein PUC55_08825 [Lachnospiraceae bacterium]|nr:hypothetical protein [Lachnospiraceae bacterium]